MVQAGAEGRERGPAPARRVTVRFSAGTWSVEGVRATPPTVLPRSEPLTDAWARDRRTAWFEAVDAGGRTVYRRSLGDPYREPVDEVAGGRLTGGLIARDERVLSLLVPDAGAGARVDVYAPPPPAAGEIARRPRPVVSAPLGGDGQ